MFMPHFDFETQRYPDVAVMHSAQLILSKLATQVFLIVKLPDYGAAHLFPLGRLIVNPVEQLPLNPSGQGRDVFLRDRRLPLPSLHSPQDRTR